MRLRVMTYNIRHGADAGFDMRLIAEDILRNRPDVVGLQEIDEGTKRIGGRHTMETLSALCGYPYYTYGKAMDYQGGAYGIAILSRHPIVESETIPLYAETEPRVLCHALLDVEGRQVDFFNTHLDYVSRDVRHMELEEIRTHLASYKSFLLTGDFNTADLSEFAVLSRCQTVNRGEFGSFFSTGDAIDHIFYTGDFIPTASAMDPVTHSDHCLIWAEFDWK